MTLIFFIAVSFVLLVYLFIWHSTNDFSVPHQGLPVIYRLLVIFPHPDDETLTCGGLLRDASAAGIKTYGLVLTKGERGVEGAHFTPQLKSVRDKEMRKSAQALGLFRFHHCDFGDGDLTVNYDKVKIAIKKYIDDIKPDLVITYDQSGLYGHPDHIVVSQITTDLLLKRKNVHLWYATRPKRILDSLNLPIHMAKDKNFIIYRTYPNFRLSLSLRAVVAKVKSMYAHKSQHFAFKKSRPWLPLWFYVATQTHEYFHEVQ